MIDDTFSRKEQWMVQFYRSRDREVVDRVARKVAGVQNVSPLSVMNIEELARHVERLANALVRDRVEQLERRIEQIELDCARVIGDLTDLRAAQSADPTGAHPYRSTGARRPLPPMPVPLPGPAAYLYPSEAPSSPVAASAAAERVEGRPGALRRVYGALGRSWSFLVCAACCVVLAWLGRFALPVLVIYAALAALNTAAAAAFAWSRP